ncbi:MAG: hypothetical protein GY827_08655 [Cytophagales bacterium]|nr:hypothetical protein [Cytophagales bacterium]
MNDSELRALVSLLDDEDSKKVVEKRILELGIGVVPLLETAWEEAGMNTPLQVEIERLISQLEFKEVKFRLLKWKNETPEDLLKGMWAIATYHFPDLSLLELRQRIEHIYHTIWVEAGLAKSDIQQIRLINNVLFDRLKFGADMRDFYNPSNSMINQVLDTKKGNPISLSVIYIIIAQKLGLPIYGVNLPNLFITMYEAGEESYYINAYNRGVIFLRDDIEEYVKKLNIPFSEEYVSPCDNLAIIKRVLRNLKSSFQQAENTLSSDDMQNLLDLLGDD